MNEPTPQPVDHRTLPRKPPDRLRSKRLVLRVTPTELERVHKLAASAGLTASDYVVRRALGWQSRQ